MKLLVGTMYCGENERDRCVESIARQDLPPFEHFIITNLPNREAHTTLYRTFMTWRDRVDLFIKIDADMILSRPTLFSEIARVFESDTQLDHLQIAVSDFFTDELIAGLNVFRSTCHWGVVHDGLFVDQNPVNVRKRINDRTRLAPAAWHCPDPSAFQAFHFGMHKALKAVEAAREQQSSRFWEHCGNVEKTWTHYQRTNDLRLLYACVGAELAFANLLRAEDVDWNNVEAQRVFYELPHNGATLAAKVAQMRRRNRRWLPAHLGHRLRIGGWGAVVKSVGHAFRRCPSSIISCFRT